MTTQPFNSDGGFSTTGNVVAENVLVVSSIGPAYPSASPAPSLNGFDSVNVLNVTVANSLIAGTITLDGGQVNASPITVTDSGIYSIDLGTTTQINVFDILFAGTSRGRVQIAGITSTTEANGLWYYQSSGVSNFVLYTDDTYSTIVDSTTWTPYTSGDGVVAVSQNIPGSNLVVNANGFLSTFTGTGQLNLPGSLTVVGDVGTDGNLYAYNAGFGGNINGAGQLNIDGDSTIGGNLFVTGNINFSGNVTQITGNSGVFYGNVQTGVGALYAGKQGFTALPNTVVQITGDDSSYVQVNLQNTNHSNVASMELAITADDGTDATNYIDMGIASSTWDGTQDNSLGDAVDRRDGYLYVQGGADGGNLVLGATTAGYGIKFNAGGPGAANTVATITANGISTGGNVSGSYILGDGGLLSNITVGGGTPVSTTGNVAAGNLISTGTVSATGNITANYFIGNGSRLTGLYGNSNVSTLLGAFGSNNISTTGTITVGNTFTNGNAQIGTALQIIGSTNTLQTTNGSAIQFANRVNFNAAGSSIVASGNISGANILGSVLSASGNVTGGNVLTAGIVSATGNITGNYILGNGSQLTGLPATYGNSNVATFLATFGSNTVSTTGTITSGNITSGNVLTGGLISATGNITGGNVLGGANVNATTHTGTTVSVTANITGGNVLTGGIVSATGTITGGNLATSGTASATGNITGGNVLTGGLISATGNITTANYFVGNLVGTTVSTTGNVSAGNLILGGQTVQLTGAVNPGYMNVGLTTSINTVGAGSVLIYDAVLKNNGTAVTYNTSTGVFTLTAGVTYNLMATGSWQAFSDTTNGYIIYAWVDATTGTRLDTTGDSDGVAEPLNRPVNEFNATAAELIYTPVTNQTVKVVVVANGGTATLRGGIGSKAIVTQINPTVSLGAVSTISATGSITAGGGLNVSGNIVGTSPNVSLVAGSYTYTFDNTGNLTLPAGGDLVFSANTSLTSISNGNITIDPNGTGQLIVTAITPASFGNTLTVTGNTTGGNILTAGIMSSTGNASHGNILTAGIISATGTITSGAGNNATAFAVGNGAVSNCALSMTPTAGTPGNYAIRDYSTANSVMFFDTTIGSANTGGSFQFRSSNAFTQLAVINTYGVSTPTKPGFRVYGNGVTSGLTTTTNGTGVLNGNNWAVDYNQGSYLNSTTGVFTAPVAGLYQINLVARVANNTAPSAQAIVIKNRGGASSNQVMWESGANPTINHFGVSTTSKLAAGDTLSLVVTVGSLTFDVNDNWSVAYLG